MLERYILQSFYHGTSSLTWVVFLSQVVPMLGMVVTVFILCWAPILIFEVLQSYNIIGTQIFGSVKQTQTCFSLLAYFTGIFKKHETILDYKLHICEPTIFFKVQILKYFYKSIWIYVKKFPQELF